MGRYSMVVLFVFCFLSVLPQTSWSEEGQVDSFLSPCGPCKTICKKTLEAIPAATIADMKCPALGTVFGSVCEGLSGEGGPISAAVCFSGGIVSTQICETVYGSPKQMIEDAGGAAKHICKKAKFCK